MKTKGDQLVEAWRAHGGSDAELGAAIDQELDNEREAIISALEAMPGADNESEGEEGWYGAGVRDSVRAIQNGKRHTDACEFNASSCEAVGFPSPCICSGTYASEIRVTATVDYLIRNWSTMTADEQIGYVRQLAERLSTAERAAAHKVTP